jgi:hypothetical protein
MSHSAHARKRPAPAKTACAKKGGGAATAVKRKEASPDQSSMGAQYSAGPVRRLGIQTKLTVGRVGDSYEREADKVAERVTTGQPAGEVSRIPAGGLAAQRRTDDAPDDAQTRAQREEDAGEGDGAPTAQAQRKSDGEDAAKAQRKDEGEDDAQAQRKEEGDDAQAQRKEEGEADAQAQRKQAEKPEAQREDTGGDEDAQAKCAACEQEEKSQRKEDGEDDAQAQRKEAEDKPAQREDDGADEDAQAKCAACEQEEKGQRKEDEGADDAAQTKEDAGDEAMLQRRAEPAESAGGEEDSAQAAAGPDPELGQECEPADGSDSESEGTAEPAAEEQGEQLGCGEGEEGAAEGEGAAAEGAQSCGGEESATEGAEGGGGGGVAEGEPAAEADPDPGAGAAAPSCAAESVGAAGESATEAAPATGEGGGQQESGECGPAQRKEEESPASELAQTARTVSADPVKRENLDTASASRMIHARGAGEPLKPNVKHRLEASLGVDVNGIRVHSDGNAQAANRALRAKAFTHRNHIFLGAGQSQHDMNLMAHEGTHVLQQEGIARRKPESPSASQGRDAASATGVATGAEGGDATMSGRALPGAKIPDALDPGKAAASAIPGAPAASGSPTPPATPGAPMAPTATPATGTAAAGKKEAGPEKGAAGEAGKEKDKGKEKTAKPGGKGAGGGAAGGSGAAVADPIAGAATGPGGEASAHPGAAAAAAARVSANQSRMSGVGQRLGREAFRQKGPAATRPKQKLASHDAATAASNAAPSPDAEPRSQAEEARANELAPKKGGKVQKQTFIELVDAKLAAMKTPATLEEMDDFNSKDGAKDLKQGLDENVEAQAGDAKKPIDDTLSAPLQVPKKREEKNMAPVPAAPQRHGLRAKDAAPAPRAEEEVTLEPNKESVEAELAKHRLTKERLEKANDPRFTAVQKAREDVHQHANRAPAEARRDETVVRTGVERKMAGAELQTAVAMRGSHRVGQGTARLHQSVGVIKEAMERQRVASDIEGIYKAAEKKVREKIDYLAGTESAEGEVDRRFTAGEETARTNFEEFVGDEMSNWKLRRYGGRASVPLIGGLLAAGTWVYDKLAGIDDHPDVVKIFDDGRKLYLSGLRITIVSIADLVESTLTACEGIIDQGKANIDTYIRERGLKPSLMAVAKQTREGVFERFDELREDVNSQREELADLLVDRYKESEEAIDARIKEMQAENRGLVSKFIDKVKEIVAAIRNFKNKIGPILAEAGDIIDEIIDDPIAFLGNLLEAIGRGFSQFKGRIDVHLKAGVVAWLFGTLGSAGVEVPKDGGSPSVGGLVLSVLGVTYDKLKTRAVRMLGPRGAAAVGAVEGKLQTLFRGGPGALWDELSADIGDLKDTILEEIKSWVITRIITAAVKKLAMMFNPVGAIIQAVITIYNVIMFFLENIDRILELVRTIVRSAADVVHGKIQAAADKIETALGMTIPLILSFLARLVNLGGVADKVRSVIGRFKTKVDRAIRNFLRKLVAKFKKAARKTAAGARKAAKKVKDVGLKILRLFLPKKVFKAGAETHTLWFRIEGETPRPVISSTTQHLSSFLDYLESRKEADVGTNATDAQKKQIVQDTKRLMPDARKKLQAMDDVLDNMQLLKRRKNAKDLLKPEGKKLQVLETDLAKLISEMIGDTSTGPAPAFPAVRKYQLEGMTAEYSALPQARGDNLDRDHQPQTDLLTHVRNLPLFQDRAIRHHVNKTDAPRGIAITLHTNRHQLGQTHGAASPATAKVDAIVKKPDPPPQRRNEILGVLRAEAKSDADAINTAVLKKANTNKTAFGDIWHLTPKADGISDKPKEASKQKLEIVKNVKSQIRSGLDRIRNQDFDRYAEKK